MSHLSGFVCLKWWSGLLNVWLQAPWTDFVPETGVSYHTASPRGAGTWTQRCPYFSPTSHPQGRTGARSTSELLTQAHKWLHSDNSPFWVI